jgi:hypothetical protein
MEGCESPLTLGWELLIINFRWKWSRYAEYKHFKLGSEAEGYRLEIGGYLGNAGDALNDPWYGSNQRPFSTFDRSGFNFQFTLLG